MAESFEKYLYRKFRAVHAQGFSELASNKKGIHLLDILIKTESEGMFPRRPVLKKAGSMIDLGTESSAEVQNILREGLADFESEDPIGGDDIFDWSYQDFDAEYSFASASSLSGSMLAGPLASVEAHFSHSRNLTTRFEDLSTACVDKDKLVEFVTSKQWKPNVEDPRLDWPQPSCVGSRGTRTLWVIQQILYAKKLEVTSGASDSVGPKVCTILPGVGAGVSVSREGSNVLNLTAGTNTKFPGKFMFAFRAVRFRFDSAGELLGKPGDDAGKHMPVHRGDDDGLYDDEAAQIRDLFLEEPPADEEKGEWDVQRLPIIEDDTDEV